MKVLMSEAINIPLVMTMSALLITVMVEACLMKVKVN